eukprot:141772_1
MINEMGNNKSKQAKLIKEHLVNLNEHQQELVIHGYLRHLAAGYQLDHTFIYSILMLYYPKIYCPPFKFDIFCKKLCKISANGRRSISLGSDALSYSSYCSATTKGWKKGINEWRI